MPDLALSIGFSELSFCSFSVVGGPGILFCIFTLGAESYLTSSTMLKDCFLTGGISVEHQRGFGLPGIPTRMPLR